MKTKTIIASIALAFSAAAFAGDNCKVNEPCQLQQPSADLYKKIALLPPASYSMKDMEAAPPAIMPGVVQFRWGQVMGWCIASADCKAKLRAELEKHDGPWADVADTMLKVIDDPKVIEAQQITWSKD